MRKWCVLGVLAAALMVAGSVVYAGPLADATKDTLWGISLGGYLDMSYTYDFNEPNASNKFKKNSIVGRAFGTDHDMIDLNALQLYIDRLPKDAGEAGFRVDLLAGQDAKVLGDLFDSSVNDISIYQAFASYIAPVGNGLTIDVGRFATWHGFESIESPSNFNFSRSLLFTGAQPYTHTGLRLTYPINDQWEVSGGITEGWNRVQEDNNNAWTFHGAVRWMPMESVYIQNSISYGPETPNNSHDYLFLYDLVATWDVTEDWTVGANFDWEQNENQGIGGKDAELWGLAGYAKYNVNEAMYLALRAEYMDDSDGMAWAAADNSLLEFTATLGYTWTEGLTTRVEFRHDDADEDMFPDKGGRLEDSQDTIALEVMYTF